MSKEYEKPGGEIIVYQSEGDGDHIQVRIEGETVWMTQNQMAALYQTTKQNVSLHVKNIYEEGELSPKATVKEYLTVRTEGNRTVRRSLDHRNPGTVYGFPVAWLRASDAAFDNYLDLRSECCYNDI